MHRIIVEDPSKQKPKRLLYLEARCAVRHSIHPCARGNVAFTDPVDMLRDAAERAASSQGVFVMVAWARVNGVAVDAIGYLALDNNGSFLYTPYNPHGWDGRHRRDGLSTADIAHAINDKYREHREGLLASRAWIVVPPNPRAGESVDRFTRVANIVVHALFNCSRSMEDLYELAS